MPAPKVSLITLTYNKKGMMVALDESIATLCKKTSYEWIIVDNGNDGTEMAIQGVNVLKHDNTGNFASMNNLATNWATGEILIFLNNDMVARSDFISDMAKILDENPDVGIVGACLYYPDDRLQHSGVIIQADLHPANLGDKAIKTLHLDPHICYPAKWESLRKFQAVTGACFAIRRQDFIDLGGFHEEFSWCFEDVDLCFRMLMHKRKMCVVSPKSVLTHFESESGGDRDVLWNLMLLQGRWRGIVRMDAHQFI